MPDSDLTTKVAVLEDRLERLQKDQIAMKSEIQRELEGLKGEIQKVRGEMKQEIEGVSDKLDGISQAITDIALRLATEDGQKKGAYWATRAIWALMLAIGAGLGTAVSIALKIHP